MNYEDFNRLFAFSKEVGASALSGKKLIFTRIILALFLCGLLIFGVLRITGYCADYSTYNNLFGNSSNVSQLLSLVPSGFSRPHYVVFSDSSGSYYCVYGKDLSYSDGSVSGSDLSYIHQHFVQSGISTVYLYDYGTFEDFELSVNHIVTSDLDFELSSRPWSYEGYKDSYFMYLSLLLWLPIIVFMIGWKNIKRDFWGSGK